MPCCGIALPAAKRKIRLDKSPDIVSLQREYLVYFTEVEDPLGDDIVFQVLKVLQIGLYGEGLSFKQEGDGGQRYFQVFHSALAAGDPGADLYFLYRMGIVFCLYRTIIQLQAGHCDRE